MNQFQKKVPRLGEKKGPSSPLVSAIAKRPIMDESMRLGSMVASPSLPSPPFGSNSSPITKPHESEQIQKLLDEAAKLVADGSKLNRGVSEFLDNTQQAKDLKREVMTQELSALQMLQVQSEVYMRLCWCVL